MKDNHAISLVGIDKSYPGVRALDNVSMSLRSGDIVGLVGKNGAGKSTLINVLSGTVAPDAGEVWVAGARVHLRSPRDARRRGINVVRQEVQLSEQLSVAENIGLGGRVPTRGRLRNPSGLRDRVRTVLQRLCAEDIDPSAQAQTLSAPQRRIVMIAKALWDEGNVLILDEPTESLTERESTHLHTALREMQARGTTIIYVSHRLHDVMDLASRVVVMRNGRIVDDRPRDAIDHDELFTLISGVAVSPVPVSPHRSPAIDDASVLLVAEDNDSSEGPGRRIVARQGDIVGIAGLVGSGRTELLREIYGADPTKAMTVRVAGGSPMRPSPRRMVGAGVGMLPEERRRQGLFLVSSVASNIAIASQPNYRRWTNIPVPSSRMEARAAREWVRRLEITAPNVLSPVLHLSGGNQQKVLIARWLARKCRVLLMDEPTNGVDVGAKREIHQTIRQLAADGGAVIVVASDLQELCELATRVIVLHGGCVIGELVGPQMTEDLILRLCYAQHTTRTSG